jgi:hypothetical protein
MKKETVSPKIFIDPVCLMKVDSGNLWGRYLERLNKATDGKSLNCH